MSSSEENIVQSMQNDGFDVWIERTPLHPNITIREPRRPVRRRRNPRCSYCRCEGHNILSCNPPEKSRIKMIVDQWCDVDEGPYANSSVQEIKNIIESSLNFYHHIGNSHCSILMIYFVVLNIRDANSIHYHSFTSTLRKIKDAVLNKRIHKIFQSGNQEQIDRLNEQLEQDRLFQRNLRRNDHLRRIYNMHQRILDLMDSRIQWNHYLTTLNGDIPLFHLNEVAFTENSLNNLNISYNNEIFNFQIQYNENPEEILSLQNPFQLSSSIIIKINKQILSENEFETWTNIDCPVCFENIKCDDVCMTNCNHKFCYQCISQTIKIDKNHKCPCCRTKIVELVNKSLMFENEKINDIICNF